MPFWEDKMYRTSFNPRPREGATAAIFSREKTVYRFNPRPREGATFERAWAAEERDVSIHAPVKGRQCWPGQALDYRQFQSTPP